MPSSSKPLWRHARAATLSSQQGGILGDGLVVQVAGNDVKTRPVSEGIEKVSQAMCKIKLKRRSRMAYNAS